MGPRVGGSLQPSNLKMSPPGIVEAPAAMDACRPEISQRFLTSSYKGSEGKVIGVDFVGTVNSATSFQIISYILNARNATTFPRLSAIASAFRRFKFQRLRFHMFGLAGSNNGGYIACTSIITDDLGTQATPSTEAQILNSEGVALARPWSFTTHDVDVDAQGLEWYSTDVSAAATEFGEAPGLAYFYTSATTVAGDNSWQVYVEYEVDISVRAAVSLVSSLSLFGGLIASGGTLAASNLLGTAAIADADSLNILATGGGTISFRQSQTAIIALNVQGTTLTAINVPAGWTQISATNTATNASIVITNTVTAGQSVGPFTMPSGTPTSALAVVSGVPPSSVSLSAKLRAISWREAAEISDQRRAPVWDVESRSWRGTNGNKYVFLDGKPVDGS